MKSSNQSPEIRVCLDVGSCSHYVAIGLSTGERLCGFPLEHTPKHIDAFFARLRLLRKEHELPISVAMEAYNGHARPIDQLVLAEGYRLYSVNNLKLARFKEIFPAPAKSDEIDAWKIFELFQMSDTLEAARNVLQEVSPIPEINAQLKRLTRRRRELIGEKVRICNRLESDLQAVAPGLLEITGQTDNLWFLNFLTMRDDLRDLPRVQLRTLLKVKGIGKTYAEAIRDWQSHVKLAPEAEWVGQMIPRDAKRVLDLLREISDMERQMKEPTNQSEIARRLLTIDGCGPISAAELAGEIGTLSRFENERSLALYCGVAPLENSSGKHQGAHAARNINRRTRSALQTIAWHHIAQNVESRHYYEKKRAEGKKHNQAVRSFARHLIRVIWSMLREGRDYEVRPMANQVIASLGQVTDPTPLLSESCV